MRKALALTVLLLPWPGCGDVEDDGARDRWSAALVTSFPPTSPLCPATSSWGAWGQTAFSKWDSDVRPIVEWIVNRTGISSSTYVGHSPSIGRAADWRPHSRDEGTQLANWFLANTKSGGKPLGIDYVIWQAQIYQLSSGVKQMEDRGSFTQNHCDHVHISFVKSVSFDAASTTPWGNAPPPDSTPPKQKDAAPPKADAGSSPDRSAPDAGAPPAPPSGDLGAAGPPLEPPPVPSTPTAPPAADPPPSGLVGGCALSPQGASCGQALWLLLLLVAAVRLRRR
jgi:hypothetical protein